MNNIEFMEECWERNSYKDFPDEVRVALRVFGSWANTHDINFFRAYARPSTFGIGGMRRGDDSAGWMKKCHPNHTHSKISVMEETILYYKMPPEVAEAFRAIIGDMARWDAEHPNERPVRYRTLRDELMDTPRGYHGQ